MKKVFLYLYPIEEYFRAPMLLDENLYAEHSWRHPLEVLNECFQKRYRDRGYEIIIAQYPDKETYGIDLMPEDKTIYTDIIFKEASGYNEEGKEKPREEIKYPNEEYLLRQVGNCNELVVGGFHKDCVKRVNNAAVNSGINSIIDPELTDDFFFLYHQKYFQTEEFSIVRYKGYLMELFGDYDTCPEMYKQYLQMLNDGDVTGPTGP